MQSYNLLVKQYLLFGRGERLGQYFVNRYIRSGRVLTSSGQDLFYVPNGRESGAAIRQWLRDHHYINSLPRRVEHA